MVSDTIIPINKQNNAGLWMIGQQALLFLCNTVEM